MADDVTITSGANSTPPAGTVIATDDVGSKHYQRVKLDGGADGVSAPFESDASTHAITTITYVHHEIHAGSAYSIVDVNDQSINNVWDIQITTPNTTKWAHFFFSFDTESETNWYFYENVTINTPGTAVVAYNANRNSLSASGLVIKSITNTTTANANTDTAVAGATQIYHGISGAGKDGGQHNHGHEIILKQAEDYCIRFIATVAGYVSYHISWYEHTDKS